jgi:hypothetical protein
MKKCKKITTKKVIRKKGKAKTRKPITHNYRFTVQFKDGSIGSYMVYDQVNEDAAKTYIIENRLKDMRHNGLRGSRKKIEFEIEMVKKS